MADLDLRGEDLASAISQTSAVVNYFNNANTKAERAAQHVGHAGLAGKVNDFADAWDIRRGKFVENLTFVYDALAAIRDTFEDIDNQIAEDLNKSGASLSSGGGGW